MECLSAVGLLFHSWVYVKSVSCIENEFGSLVMRSKASAPDNLLWYEQLNSFHFGREFNCFFSQHLKNDGAVTNKSRLSTGTGLVSSHRLQDVTTAERGQLRVGNGEQLEIDEERQDLFFHHG